MPDLLTQDPQLAKSSGASALRCNEIELIRNLTLTSSVTFHIRISRIPI